MVVTRRSLTAKRPSGQRSRLIRVSSIGHRARARRSLAGDIMLRADIALSRGCSSVRIHRLNELVWKTRYHTHPVRRWLIVDSTAIGPPCDSQSTAIPPRYNHSTTCVTTKSLKRRRNKQAVWEAATIYPRPPAKWKCCPNHMWCGQPLCQF